MTSINRLVAPILAALLLCSCRFSTPVARDVFSGDDHVPLALSGTYYEKSIDTLNEGIDKYDKNKVLTVRSFSDHVEVTMDIDDELKNTTLFVRTIPTDVKGYFIANTYKIIDKDGKPLSPCRVEGNVCPGGSTGQPPYLFESIRLIYVSKGGLMIYRDYDRKGSVEKDLDRTENNLRPIFRYVATVLNSAICKEKSENSQRQCAKEYFDASRSIDKRVYIEYFGKLARIAEKYKDYYRAGSEEDEKKKISVFDRRVYISSVQYGAARKMEGTVMTGIAAVILGKLIWDALPSAPPRTSSTYSRPDQTSVAREDAFRQCRNTYESCMATCEGFSDKSPDIWTTTPQEACKSRCRNMGC